VALNLAKNPGFEKVIKNAGISLSGCRPIQKKMKASTAYMTVE